MAYVEILTDNGLTVEQWDSDIFEEYLGQLWWKNLMGTSEDSVIQVLEDLTKSPGDAITVGLMGEMQGGKVTGNSKGKGNEGRVDFFNQRIVVDNIRYLIKIEDIPMTQKRVGFDVLQKAKRALVTKSRLGLEDDITTALTTIGAERVRGRYLYGAADSNWDSTPATALATIDATNDVLTAAMIDIAKRKATIPVNATAKIRPMMVKVGKNFEEWFVFVGHTYAIRDLVNSDAAFRNAQLLLPPNANRDSVLFTGSSFKGSWNGVLIYEYENLPLYTNTNSVQCAHNLLLGAQAAAVVWGQRSKFGEEEEDLGHDRIYETHEIREESKLIFNRSTTEDNGLVNLLSAGVAD